MIMDEFTQNGMKYNASILAAFMWTKVTGGNAAARVAGSIASLDFKIKNLNNTLKEVKKELAAASAQATTASNSAKDVKGKLAKLFQANTSLKR
jgi:peptidoglycan hydrolase CwlO-like protein